LARPLTTIGRHRTPVGLVVRAEGYSAPVAVVSFTQALARHVDCPSAGVVGSTVREALDAYFAEHAGVRHYVLDDQGAVRKHVTVFLAGHQIRDRVRLTDPVGVDDEIHVMQALSGG
jgi:hypothetical protein